MRRWGRNFVVGFGYLLVLLVFTAIGRTAGGQEHIHWDRVPAGLFVGALVCAGLAFFDTPKQIDWLDGLRRLLRRER